MQMSALIAPTARIAKMAGLTAALLSVRLGGFADARTDSHTQAGFWSRKPRRDLHQPNPQHRRLPAIRRSSVRSPICGAS
jgi:hypothetical protein